MYVHVHVLTPEGKESNGSKTVHFGRENYEYLKRSTFPSEKYFTDTLMMYDGMKNMP